FDFYDKFYHKGTPQSKRYQTAVEVNETKEKTRHMTDEKKNRHSVKRLCWRRVRSFKKNYFVIGINLSWKEYVGPVKEFYSRMIIWD
ncbi:hypothetical protein SNEBB_002570, partial [Seison nebaliae]